ncbi:hypothetical protein L228DRAFT_211919 [Xylona heveae TC161]|uniref:Vacuolar calcium ion transporter n=1 Tax=Xylona heveae (strain CBS 132557 / TC161) TaxID=1328760 RepID=A0A165FZ08_XYLHT|nr:hypothetical protein L228DRAFT_211919 [Xylona heveae TC161]KZF21550.1 hypothetical protein L228DRAFT_211919 [Xylona heveae TC161]
MPLAHRPQSNASRQNVEPKLPDDDVITPPHRSTSTARSPEHRHHHVPHLPRFNHNGHKVTRGIHPDGESGRKGIHPWEFLKIVFRSTSTASKLVNILWPFVPVAIAMHFARPDQHLWIFILNYVAMVPAANLVGFGGQELARKLPKVLGVMLETTLGSIVEIVLFMVLIHNSKNNNLIPVIQAAILGSMLANLLLCLGFCFFAGGLRRDEQTFDPAISEVGNGLLLVAGMGLMVPSAFYTALDGVMPNDLLRSRVLTISRITSIFLLIAFAIYVWFQMRTHHGIYLEILEKDEELDEDRHRDLKKDKLTLTECFIALAIALACVSMHAVFLVEQIHYLVEERGVSDNFIGLILVPLVEKAAEHLTAVDEAWDNQMNFALAHVLGATIQTALLNAPLVVMAGWGLHKEMDLNFEIFMIVLFILSIIVVGNFLKDGKSNYLEGALCVLVYLIIAVTTWFYPDPKEGSTNTQPETEAPEKLRMLFR